MGSLSHGYVKWITLNFGTFHLVCQFGPKKHKGKALHMKYQYIRSACRAFFCSCISKTNVLNMQLFMNMLQNLGSATTSACKRTSLLHFVPLETLFNSLFAPCGNINTQQITGWKISKYESVMEYQRYRMEKKKQASVSKLQRT